MMNFNDLIGTPFKNHGRDVNIGLDCYGLVIEVYRRQGIELPEYDADYNDAMKISGIIHHQIQSRHWQECWKPLPVPCVLAIRFGSGPGVINHTGVYLGHGKFIHIREKTGVVIDRIDSPAWRGVIAGFYEYRGDCE